MSYLFNLWRKYKQYKLIKNNKLATWRNMLSSSTYCKYNKNFDFTGKAVLNFGAGGAYFPAPNVVNLDCIPGEGVNIVVPASEIHLPFPNNTFDHIIANHVMEHLPNWFETMKEFARIVRVGGIIEIWIPPVSSDTAFTYRDHVNRIGDESFAGCQSMTRPGSNILAASEFNSFGDFAKLKLLDTYTRTITTWWVMLAPQWALQWMCTYLRNIVSEVGFKFTKGE